MHRFVSLVTACVLVLSTASPLFAQQRLFALTATEIIEIDINPQSFGRAVRRIRVPVSEFIGVPFTSVSKPVAVAGGALLTWIVDGRLVVFDVASGQITQVWVAGLVDLRSVLAVSRDGNRILLFGGTVTSSAVAVVGVGQGSLRFIDIGVGVRAVAYAAESDLLFVARNTVNAGLAEVDVLSASSGASIKTIPGVPRDVVGLAVTAAGTRVFANTASGGVFAFDAISAALSAAGAYPSNAPPPALDETRHRLLALAGTPPFVAALSPETLQLVGRVYLTPAAPRSGGAIADFEVSAQSATILAFAAGPQCQRLLLALNAETGDLRRTGEMPPSGTGNCDAVRLVLLTEPGAPANFASTVTGHTVNLEWASADATRYEIEAGSAPGLANLATISVTETHLTVDGAPPGVYYLRVRAINTIGKSAPSQETRVVVQ